MTKRAGQSSTPDLATALAWENACNLLAQPPRFRCNMPNNDDSKCDSVVQENHSRTQALRRTIDDIGRKGRSPSADAIRGILFLLFFLSGFCSLVYEVVWTRLAFASFGIITPVLSVVLSVFMLGLSIGAWLAGRSIAGWVQKAGRSAIVLYGAAELLIGAGAFAVPALFALGERYLLGAGQTNSVGYLVLSALVLAVSILPWCICMGATFPCMMAFVREWDREFAGSFSYLYIANVLGAMSGTLMTAVILVEAFGFRHTLWIAAGGNFAIAAVSAGVAWWRRKTPLPPREADDPAAEAVPARSDGLRGRDALWLLFSTGFCSMAMEVVWSRSFTPVLKTQVYSFAAVVFAYLGATFLGSLKYRRDLAKNTRCRPASLVALLATFAFLPVLVNDPRLLKMNVGDVIHLPTAGILLASIVPLCAMLGYLTPQLVDQYASGHPRLAGKAYALNVLGCIVGPLVASYILLPHISERYALILLGAPFVAYLIRYLRTLAPLPRWGSGLAAGTALSCALLISKGYDECVLACSPGSRVRRDYAASVTAYGSGMDKLLLVNGVGMTILTPVTKLMVHLPLALLKGKPDSALIVCFGMGTTYRSSLSWHIDTTVVELVPSVTRMFDYYHADAVRLLQQPRNHIVIDDGRRFLRRVGTRYDVITVDPPPPVETAGSSLLYSREFMELAKQHLRPGGILQVWTTGAEEATKRAIFRTVFDAFPHVRSFVAEKHMGYYLLASMEPIEVPAANELAARFPDSAKRDLVEWSQTKDVAQYLQETLAREFPVEGVLSPNPNLCITDDQPFNEYFLMRRLLFAPAKR